jgi:GDP-L-fucose synthase
MVGSALVRRLEREACTVLTADRSQVDLQERGQVEAWISTHRPDVVFLAAAKVGGIVANDTHRVAFLLDNLQIQTNVISQSAAHGVSRLVFLGSSCIYPKFAPQPISETSLLEGALEPTNQWYAIAKIAGLKLCEAYSTERGLHYSSVMPTNLYGPNDNFDLQSSHVLPALVRKIHEAKVGGNEEVTLWGTGTPRREFLFVDDCADAVVFAAKHQPGGGLLNVGTGEDLQIAELAKIIADVVGWKGRFVFDTTKPDGTPRKLLDVSALKSLGWTASTPLREGIERSYRWFCESR